MTPPIITQSQIASAVFSEDRAYRYTLSRCWGDWFSGGKPGYVAFCCLNPSTADETVDDPTIRRCVGFSKAWGYSGFVMVNLFAIRATDPKVMLKHPEPVGSENDKWICDIAKSAALIICAWGNHGGHKGRCYKVQRMLMQKHGLTLMRLGLTNTGFPKHPLYIAGNTIPQPL